MRLIKDHRRFSLTARQRRLKIKVECKAGVSLRQFLKLTLHLPISLETHNTSSHTRINIESDLTSIHRTSLLSLGRKEILKRCQTLLPARLHPSKDMVLLQIRNNIRNIPDHHDPLVLLIHSLD
jgi:hypothetical protein